MNRRKLLSLIGATALSPVIPAQVFASGGIMSPKSFCLIGEIGPEILAASMPCQSHAIGIDPISMFVNLTRENLTR